MNLFKKLPVLACLAALLSAGAFAADNPLPIGGKHDNHAPIDVTSDSLEVMQEENKAVFTGHVVAIQGDTRLKADTMVVHYTRQDDDKAKASPRPVRPKAGAAPGTGAIKKIDVSGNVFLSTPEETASGASGVYDVEQQVIDLNDNVVLTKGKNVLKGDKLVYNLSTGKSVLTSGAGTEEQGHAGGGRVHALFVPENNDKMKK